MLDKDKHSHANLTMDNPSNENDKKGLLAVICSLAILFFAVDLITELGVAGGRIQPRDMSGLR